MGIIQHDIFNWQFGDITDTYLSLRCPIDIVKTIVVGEVMYNVSASVNRYFNYTKTNCQPIESFRVSITVNSAGLSNPYMMIFNHLKEGIVSYTDN